MTLDTVKKICGIIVFTMVLVGVVINLDPISKTINTVLTVASPLFLGGCIAFVINVPMLGIERLLKKYVFKQAGLQKYLRATSILITFLLSALVITLVIVAVIPQLIASVASIALQIPVFFDDMSALIMTYTNNPYIVEIVQNLTIDWSSILQQAVDVATDWLNSLVSQIASVTSSAIGAVIQWILAFVFSIYILFNKETLERQFKILAVAYLPEKIKNKIFEVSGLTYNTFYRFICGQCLEAIIVGTIFLIVLNILGMPYAVLISVLIAVTALIPVVGAFIGCIIGAFLILIESPIQALIFLIAFLVVQQIEGNLIYPRVMGTSLGLPSIWILFAVTVGGSLGGVAGILIFIPVAATAYSLLRTATYSKLKREGKLSQIE